MTTPTPICRVPGCTEHTPWWLRPACWQGHTSRGIDFHAAGLQHGPASRFANKLRERAVTEGPKKEA